MQGKANLTLGRFRTAATPGLVVESFYPTPSLDFATLLSEEVRGTPPRIYFTGFARLVPKFDRFAQTDTKLGMANQPSGSMLLRCWAESGITASLQEEL